MSALFEPYTLKDVTLRNRIAIPPMCQYMAEDGMINDWHHVHLAGLARGGAGLVVVEATAVSPEGRITPGCAGIWSDAHAQAFVPVVQAIKAAGRCRASRSPTPGARPAPTAHGKVTTTSPPTTRLGHHRPVGHRLWRPPAESAKGHDPGRHRPGQAGLRRCRPPCP
jgi:2,4-dienoyl-CoA reductase-like NADH-dependent reductase (Old Yellow Enzyme family)